MALAQQKSDRGVLLDTTPCHTLQAQIRNRCHGRDAWRPYIYLLQ